MRPYPAQRPGVPATYLNIMSCRKAAGFCKYVENDFDPTELSAMAANDNKVEVACSVCRQRLRLPRDRVGTVGCPRCRNRFKADTNTVILTGDDPGEFNIEPASTVTYRILKLRKNTGLLLVCLLICILSAFLAGILLVSALFNNWQITYLNYALVFGGMAGVSLLILIIGGSRDYIDIRPTEIYSSKLGLTIEYGNVDDIVKYYEQRGRIDHNSRQKNSSVFYTRGHSVPDILGNIQGLHINSLAGKSIDITREYITYMKDISDLIAARVAMAKESPIIWS
jgi:hypothetical protein